MSVLAHRRGFMVRSTAHAVVRVGALGGSVACGLLAVWMGGMGVGPFIDLPSLMIVGLPTVGLTVAAFGPREPVESVAFLFAGNPTEAQLSRGSGIAFAVGGIALATGMLGSLIGVVQMLQTLSDPTSVGPAMSLALLTTMYGIAVALLAFVAALRLAERSGRADVLAASGGVGLLAMSAAGVVFFAPVIATAFGVMAAFLLVF
jgi:hypothetical protein